MRVISSSLIAVLLTAGVSVPVPAVAASADPIRLDVGLVEGADPATVVAELGTGTFQQVAGLNAIAVEVPADRVGAVLARLGNTAGVRFAERGAIVQADSARTNIGFNQVEVPQAWTWTTGSPDVTVAVVDTGVTPTVDLTADRLTPGRDFVDGDDDAVDGSGHGTLVAGVIAGDIDNEESASSGVCDTCRVMPVRVLRDRGTSAAEGYSSDVASGITWAADHGARIINLSLSTATDSQLLREAVQYAADKGSLVVASAGNVTGAVRRYPAAYESVLAVARTGANRNSAADQWADVSGTSGMLVVGRDGVKKQLGGTSSSAALVAGVAALAFSFKPAATAAEVRDLIKRNAEPLSGLPAYTAPLVNAARTIHDLGAADEVDPVVTATGFAEDELVGAAGRQVFPVVSDDHGIDRVETVVNGTVVATSKRPLWLATVRPPAGFNGPLPVTVRAYDYNGNVSEATTVIRVDSSAPRGTRVSPALNAVVHDTVDVSISTPDTDVVQVYSPWSGFFIWDATTRLWKGTLPVDSSHGLEATLVDQAGNRTTLHLDDLRVDQDPPAGGTIAPASGARIRGTFTSTLTSVTDLSGVVKAGLWVNGRYNGAGFSQKVRTGTYSGTVSLIWKVTDRFGQTRTLPVRTVVADNKAPTVSITKAPRNRAKVKGTIKVYAKASDASGVARVELIVNGKVVANDKTSGYVLSVNANKQKKTMKVRVRAYDKLGNVTSTTTRTWYRK
ncbi:hypothetical protein ADL15_22300 [Actinoplanes awajinensis subsp. mycoplanecinus]|uniref:Peptidase S8/S53 domain-containing protein n=1 Tax=Actinoplanes awajinensis subsp. mycoplanecinus TaxID=135947 RepID=A0A117MR86_9ACTN|nr:hypothetical protein ADL15_22300 [Actinoplanes awajinensis subsp. mycoplanecinus]